MEKSPALRKKKRSLSARGLIGEKKIKDTNRRRSSRGVPVGKRGRSHLLVGKSRGELFGSTQKGAQGRAACSRGGGE